MTKQIDPTKIPRHVAIIMDGNGRWAQSRALPRAQGHSEGVRRVEEIIDTAREIGIEIVTLFTFSTENWGRPAHEVSLIMNMLAAILDKKLQKLKNDNIQLRLIGRREGIPLSLLAAFEKVVSKTRDNTGLVVNLAFNYGGRAEIVDAIKSIARSVQDGRLAPGDICEATVNGALYTKGLPDPDLLIRTSGELRISNFLLWQLSYAEFYFTEKLWPDFGPEEFKKTILDYQGRERRYGQVTAKEGCGE